VAFSIDDAWDNCGPVARAGNTAFGVYCRCGAWAARNSSDGYVPAEVALAYGSPELAKKLVDVGLWEAADGGWVMPHYLERNESAAQVGARRKRDADRKARWREKQSQVDETRESGRSHGVTPRRVRSSSTPPKGGKGALSSVALPKPHPFSDDGQGNCSICPLPKINVKVHR
jgi:hypothetical protein